MTALQHPNSSTSTGVLSRVSLFRPQRPRKVIFTGTSRGITQKYTNENTSNTAQVILSQLMDTFVLKLGSSSKTGRVTEVGTCSVILPAAFHASA